jgi:hypothetical protein
MIAFFKTLGDLLKVILFFGNLWKEKNEEKAEAKAEIGKDIINAFKQTNKKTRASRLNASLDNIGKL